VRWCAYGLRSSTTFLKLVLKRIQGIGRICISN
jgi:hypothetical protein